MRAFFLAFPKKVQAVPGLSSALMAQFPLPWTHYVSLRVGDEWYRVDLVFFHRRLRCLILIDLKLGKFTHADAGQMYLSLGHCMCDRAGFMPTSADIVGQSFWCLGHGESLGVSQLNPNAEEFRYVHSD